MCFRTSFLLPGGRARYRNSLRHENVINFISIIIQIVGGFFGKKMLTIVS
ncbi:hypothetical protein ATPR_3147 [Acetobacter tropicalis NBRC 101654]|uniref:Uncharacterized protein n=1 Tax=Acetobacter tropicalis NBRC 101654 TaxID=749388 RepID=F7VIE8_9PROT|nr:hypothetical protein ATPR_3147 [Acetobacter tropicalis NBRC 101654]